MFPTQGFPKKEEETSPTTSETFQLGSSENRPRVWMYIWIMDMHW